MIKKIITPIILITMILTLCLPVYANTLTVNGRSLDCYIENGITYASVREFTEQYNGYSVGWDNKTKIVTVTGSGLDAKVYQGQPYLTANGRVLTRDGINRNKDGRVYAPVTELSKMLSASVEWNPGTRRVTVSGGGQALASADNYYNSEDLYWLSRIISAESRGESFMGKVGVGNVVLNRRSSSQFPNTVKDVVFDTKFGVQFSPISDGSIYNDPTAESVMAAKAVLEGFVKVDGALYFLNPRTAQNNWIVQNRRFCIRIGNHDFYY
ncbi:MAG: cell wall hydrolase [Clostridia bacterium]|nr:cell wall hydrolase [Clostridia bacterium]